MIATFTEHKLTPMSLDEAAAAMAAGLRDHLKAPPSREVLALALAKSALECGRWRYCRNWNLGNIRPRKTEGGMYTCFPICNEIESDGKVHWYAPTGEVRSGTDLTVIKDPWAAPPAVGRDGGVGHPASRFRAYANRFDGAFAYCDFVASGRYAAAWAKLLTGDAVGFVAALKRAGYMTADEAPYRTAVVSLQKEFLGKLSGQNPETFDPPDHEWENLRAAIVGGSWQRAQDAVDQSRHEEPGDDDGPQVA
jgi:hypothetical protein